MAGGSRGYGSVPSQTSTIGRYIYGQCLFIGWAAMVVHIVSGKYSPFYLLKYQHWPNDWPDFDWDKTDWSLIIAFRIGIDLLIMWKCISWCLFFILFRWWKHNAKPSHTKPWWNCPNFKWISNAPKERLFRSTKLYLNKKNCIFFQN